MSLQYVTKISAAISYTAGATNETDHQVMFGASDATFRRYDLTTYGQIGTNLALAATSRGITMLSSASAISFTSGSTIELIELATEYRQSYSGGSGLSSTRTSQTVASDIANKIAIAASFNSARTIVKFNGNTFSATVIQPEWTGNAIATCIIYKESNRFLIGTSEGQIFEIDSNGTIVDSFILQNFFGSSTPNVLALSYYNGFLIAVDINNNLYYIDWTTKTILNRTMVDGSFSDFTMCAAASGVSILGRNSSVDATTSNMIYEVDLGRLDSPGQLFSNDFGAIQGSGIDSTLGRGWVFQANLNRIVIFDIVPRNTQEVVISSPTGDPFRVIILDESGGKGTLKKVIDTYTTSPRTVLLETGKDYMELIKVGEGTNAQWDVSRYSL